MVLYWIIIAVCLTCFLGIFVWKKFGDKMPKGLFYTGIMVFSMGLIFPTISVIAHKAGNESAYQVALQYRNDLCDQGTKALLGSSQEDYLAFEELAKAFNAELDEEKRLHDDAMVSWFVYDYAFDHYDDLYIQLPLVIPVE